MEDIINQNEIKNLDDKASDEFLALANKFEDDIDRFNCYHRAAQLGHPQGQYKTGFYYWNGFGVEKDKKKAIEWYIKASEQGHRVAKYILSCVGLNK